MAFETVLDVGFHLAWNKSPPKGAPFAYRLLNFALHTHTHLKQVMNHSLCHGFLLKQTQKELMGIVCSADYNAR